MSSRILVIDDEEEIRAELELYLTQKKFEVSTAHNGIDGIFVFERDKPDLVLTDFRMPGMDGIETLRKIKQLNKKIPVIVVSGNADMQTCVDALNHEAFEFLDKPVDLKKLLDSVRRALAGEAPWWDKK